MKILSIILLVLCCSKTFANSMCPEFHFKNLSCVETRKSLNGAFSQVEFTIDEISNKEVQDGVFEFTQVRAGEPWIKVTLPGEIPFKKYNRIYKCALGLINYGDVFEGSSTSRIMQLLENSDQGLLKVFGYAFVNEGHDVEDVVEIERFCR